MAIVKNFWLKGNTKTLADAVLYVTNGETRMRSKAVEISNPRTTAQMTQRVKLANLVGMYRANRLWMDTYAYENKPATWSVYNAFVSKNMASSQVYLTKEQAAAGTTIVAPYLMTDGSLPPIEVNATTANLWQTNLDVTGIDSLATASVADFTSALLENNNILAEGMQLSLIVNYQTQFGGSYIVTARWYEVILDSANTAPLSNYLADQHLAISGNQLAFQVGGNDPVLGFMFCLSSSTISRTRVSPQRMILTDTSVYNLFSSASALAAATTSYGESTNTPFLVANYGGGASSNVPIAQSILSVNGKSAGTYLGTGESNNATFAVILSQAAGNVSSVGIQTTNETFSSNVGEALAYTVDGNVVTISTTGIGSSNTSVIIRIRVTIDGVEYSIAFKADEGDGLVE